MPWKEGEGLPEDGWYGGRVDWMIKNGTYADFRPKIEQRAKNGYYKRIGTMEERKEASLKQLQKWDEEWAALPIEEQRKRRNRVAEHSKVRLVTVLSPLGPKRVWRAKPSRFDLESEERMVRKEARGRMPSGAITAENDPLKARVGRPPSPVPA